MNGSITGMRNSLGVLAGTSAQGKILDAGLAAD